MLKHLLLLQLPHDAQVRLNFCPFIWLFLRRILVVAIQKLSTKHQYVFRICCQSLVNGQLTIQSSQRDTFPHLLYMALF